MPKVEIIYFTGMDAAAYDSTNQHLNEWEKQFAARLLVFTKQTRLQMDGARFDAVLNMQWDDIVKEIDYMAGTIPSSWEFVDVTFALQQVSRACAQQITRTRFTPMDADIFGSYAMQSFRVEELKELTFHVNPERNEDEKALLQQAHNIGAMWYKRAIEAGIPQQDARGLLPMDTHCNLVVKFNLRQLVDMLRTRDESLRVQGEYGEVAHQMKERVLEIWPWSATFFEPKNDKAVRMIEEVAIELRENDSDANSVDLGGLSTKLAKAADLLKK